MQRRVCINLCQASATFPVAQATVHRSSHFAYLISSRIKASPCVIQAQGNHLICRALQDRGVACWKQRRRVLIGMPRMPEIRCSASGAAMGKGCQPVIVKLCSAARQYFAAGKTPQKREIQEMCNLLSKCCQTACVQAPGASTLDTTAALQQPLFSLV